jgi:micrococcal nuclease
MSAPEVTWLGWLLGLGLTVVFGAGCGGASPCGPERGVVADVVDGDTIVLESGERIRYLLVDTPESTGGKDDCYGREARTYNAQLVQGREVTLTYGEACTDRFERTLAYVSVGSTDVNAELVRRGFGCVLHIPPAGTSRHEEFQGYQDAAEAAGRGLWSACPPPQCAG